MTSIGISGVGAVSSRVTARRLAERYHAFVVVFMMLAYYCGISMYLGKLKVNRPSVWIGTLILLTLPLLLGRIESWRALTRTPLTAWVLFYMAVNVAGYGWSSRSVVATDILRETISYCITILGFIVILSSARAVRLARGCVAICVVVAVGMNAYDLIHPGSFSENLGRAAGLYVNPNTTGAALVVGLILGIDVVPDRWRGAYVVAAVAGVLSTLSRAGIIGVMFVLAVLIFSRRVRVRSIVVSVAIMLAAGLVFLVGTSKGRQLQDLFMLASRTGVLDRIADPSVASQESNGSTVLRVTVLKKGWAMFRQHPFRGGGLAATSEWGIRQSTHNIYVRHLAEFGAIGFVLYPLLLLACIAGARGETRVTGAMFAGFMFVNGLFTHNNLDELNFLVGYALMSAVAWQSLALEVERRRQLVFAVNEPSAAVT